MLDSGSACENEVYPDSAPINAYLEGDVAPAVEVLLAENLRAQQVFTGDSLMEQWPDSAAGGAFAFNDPGVVPLSVNAGVTGSTLCNLTRRVHRHVTPFAPQAVVTTGGGNDLLLDAPPETVRVNLQDYLILLRAQNPGSRLIYIEIPPARVPIEGFSFDRVYVNDYARWLLEELGNACYVRNGDLLAERRIGFVEAPLAADYTTDGIHWTSAAYAPIEARVQQALAGESGDGVQCFP